MKLLWIVVIIIVIVGIIYAAYVFYRPPLSDKGLFNESTAKQKCIQACQTALDAGQNLENGPCLSNKIADDWVCDVAHSPRQAIDNDPANQCPEYGKSAKHFVEVTPDCKFIKAV